MLLEWDAEIPSFPEVHREALRAHDFVTRGAIPTPRGIACFTVDEAMQAAQQLGGKVWVVKAQIHAGGRGKGGGVKVAKSMDEVKQYATQRKVEVAKMKAAAAK